MTEWRCLITLADGSTDLRVVQAGSTEEAFAQVTSPGTSILDIREGRSSIFDRLRQPLVAASRLGVSEQALLLTQLATLVRSGLPVDRSLDLLSDQASRPSARKVLARMTAAVRSGGGLATAFAESGVFPAYVTGVIRASERGGGLGDALAALAERLTLSSATRRQLLTALTYPAAILAATLAALAIVLTLVVPQFQPIFAGQEDKLPSLTRAVLALSNAVTGAPWMVAAIAVGLPLSIVALSRSTPGQRLLEAYGHRVPLLGLRDQYLAAQFTGILATLLGNGVRIVDALPLVRDAIGSRRWQTHAGLVEQRIREGSSLSAALTSDGLLPTTAIRLIEVGEKSGKLAETCGQASAIIGEAARSRIERIVALANPIAIITLGGMVAALVGGVMLGIFALGDFAG
jgi:type II secretory pathway component PulF